MTIAALDLATTTGHASIASGVVTSGIFRCRHKPKEQWGVCFLRFRDWLREWLDQEKPEKLYYESVMRFSSSSAARVYCGLLAIVLMECERRGVVAVGVSVGSVKKAATGNGRASKQEMVDAAWETWGIKTQTDDEADSLGILGLALELEKQPKYDNTPNRRHRT